MSGGFGTRRSGEIDCPQLEVSFCTIITANPEAGDKMTDTKTNSCRTPHYKSKKMRHRSKKAPAQVTTFPTSSDLPSISVTPVTAKAFCLLFCFSRWHHLALSSWTCLTLIWPWRARSTTEVTMWRLTRVNFKGPSGELGSAHISTFVYVPCMNRVCKLVATSSNSLCVSFCTVNHWLPSEIF